MLFACFWFGSMLTLPLVLLPSIKDHPDRRKLLYGTGIKLRFWGWIALMGLLITGFSNIFFRGLPISWEMLTATNYGQLISYKLIIFVFILLASGIHDFFIGGKALEEITDQDSKKITQVARWSGRLILLLALAAAFLGVAASRGGF